MTRFFRRCPNTRSTHEKPVERTTRASARRQHAMNTHVLYVRPVGLDRSSSRTNVARIVSIPGTRARTELARRQAATCQGLNCDAGRCSPVRNSRAPGASNEKTLNEEDPECFSLASQGSCVSCACIDASRCKFSPERCSSCEQSVAEQYLHTRSKCVARDQFPRAFQFSNFLMKSLARSMLRRFCGVSSGARRTYSRNCLAASSNFPSRRNSSPRL